MHMDTLVLFILELVCIVYSAGQLKNKYQTQISLYLETSSSITKIASYAVWYTSWTQENPFRDAISDTHLWSKFFAHHNNIWHTMPSG